MSFDYAQQSVSPRQNQPKFQEVGNEFFAQTEAGEIRIPLRVTMRTILEMQDQSEIQQLVTLLEKAGDRHTADLILDLDITESSALVKAYFEVIEKRIAAAGEGRPSSR